MNRLIKFRAWDELDRKMSIWTLNDLLVNFGYSEINDRPSPFFDYMQYTGLKDKNGKEIYEGDIVQYGLRRSLIEWKNELGAFYTVSKIQQSNQGNFHWFEMPGIYERVSDKFEIIGNIYENQELLSSN